MSKTLKHDVYKKYCLLLVELAQWYLTIMRINHNTTRYTTLYLPVGNLSQENQKYCNMQYNNFRLLSKTSSPPVYDTLLRAPVRLNT